MVNKIVEIDMEKVKFFTEQFENASIESVLEEYYEDRSHSWEEVFSIYSKLISTGNLLLGGFENRRMFNLVEEGLINAKTGVVDWEAVNDFYIRNQLDNVDNEDTETTPLKLELRNAGVI